METDLIFLDDKIECFRNDILSLKEEYVVCKKCGNSLRNVKAKDLIREYTTQRQRENENGKHCRKGFPEELVKPPVTMMRWIECN
ncbi:MAG: hypothetical protein ABIH80_02600 [Methanobacteriota archaeon]